MRKKSSAKEKLGRVLGSSARFKCEREKKERGLWRLRRLILTHGDTEEGKREGVGEKDECGLIKPNLIP